MKIVSISDTHGQHRSIVIPPADIFIFAGDISFFNSSLKQYTDFNDWLGTLPCKYKICICGNHDEFFEKKSIQAREVMTNCIYLQDELIVIDGIKFYGSPYTPYFYGWAFNLSRGQQLAEKWSLIPDDIDVLITHGGPFQICDYADGKSVGCEELQKRVFEVKPKLHLFGHVHQCCGKYERHGKTLFYNVAMNGTQSYEIEINNEIANIVGESDEF